MPLLGAAPGRAYTQAVAGCLCGGRMPVTAKLSRRFYEKLGDDIATELVE